MTLSIDAATKKLSSNEYELIKVRSCDGLKHKIIWVGILQAGCLSDCQYRV